MILKNTIVCILLLFITPISTHAQLSQKSTRKIVVFNANVQPGKRQSILENYGINKSSDLGIIPAQSVELTSDIENKLRQHSGVTRIDDDTVIMLFQQENTQEIPDDTESIPWGINRISAQEGWTSSTGDPIRVGVIDTGIDLDHPDLVNNIKGGFNALNSALSIDDNNGHGTHVAGTISASRNNFGVIGVGPDIDLFAIKAFDARGTAHISSIIQGLDWSISNNMQVINLSFGINSDVPLLHDAVVRAWQSGIILVAAAGNNSGGLVTYPAAYSEVIAVSAIDKKDGIASFSSAGNEVDVAAPGEAIASTYPEGKYQIMSGTSMSAPHVTGAAALLIDQCRMCSPSTIKEKILYTAEDRGVSGQDTHYGYGVLNVARALAN